MGDKSAIEWTDATWNPIVGCTIVSKGCTNCYAMRTAGARTKHTAKYSGLTQPSKAGPVWTGEVRLWEKALTDPLGWKEPRRVFVNSMGDLFHEDVPDAWIDRCFAVMALAPQHTFQILTKRPERMRDYCKSLGRHHEVDRVSLAATALRPDGKGFFWELSDAGWHLPNVWLGVSTEDQATADARIPPLLDTPAAVRFISAEPLLRAIDLNGYLEPGVEEWGDDDEVLAGLDWVIAGGESGRGARPMHPDWARSLRDECQAAGVPFLFKQWGEWEPISLWTGHRGGGRFRREDAIDRDGERVSPDVNPDDVGGQRFACVGKTAAGRILDGREWNDFPARVPT